MKDKTIFKDLLKYKIFILCFAICLSQRGFAVQKAIDYLGVGEKIEFAGQDYYLAWSSHPKSNFYKQEYILKNDQLPNYKRMIMVDFLAEDIEIKSAVAQFVKNLNDRKKTDLFANYRLLKQNEDYVLDFTLSDKVENNGKLNTFEHNVYRYFMTNNRKINKKGMMIFAVSERAYGRENIERMVYSIETSPLLEQLIETKKPEVK